MADPEEMGEGGGGVMGAGVRGTGEESVALTLGSLGQCEECGLYLRTFGSQYVVFKQKRSLWLKWGERFVVGTRTNGGGTGEKAISVVRGKRC